jgi:hypothetical protein
MAAHAAHTVAALMAAHAAHTVAALMAAHAAHTVAALIPPWVAALTTKPTSRTTILAHRVLFSCAVPP